MKKCVLRYRRVSHSASLRCPALAHLDCPFHCSRDDTFRTPWFTILTSASPATQSTLEHRTSVKIVSIWKCLTQRTNSVSEKPDGLLQFVYNLTIFGLSSFDTSVQSPGEPCSSCPHPILASSGPCRVVGIPWSDQKKPSLGSKLSFHEAAWRRVGGMMPSHQQEQVSVIICCDRCSFECLHVHVENPTASLKKTIPDTLSRQLNRPDHIASFTSFSTIA